MGTNTSHLSNEDLLESLHAIVTQGRVVLARLLAYLAEVEERRLDLESACSSIFDYCVRRLGLSEDEAYRRVVAARLGRRFPLALEMIERGELTLTTMILLRDHLTDENHEELLRAATAKTKNEVREIIAARFPRPDLPSLIQTLPIKSPAEVAALPAPARADLGATPARIEPLAPERYGVQFTASAELKQKIERARNLLRHQNPSGDLSVVVDRAFDLLLEKLESQRLGKSSRPKANRSRENTRRGYVTRAVRREVFERDGERCTFVDKDGRRCESRTFLELDHQDPRARGGNDRAENLAVRCRQHNGLEAERVFGRAHVEGRKAARRNDVPRQRVQEGETNPRQSERSETAVGALRGLGFKEHDARRALARISERWQDAEPPLERILRDALAVLTTSA